MNLGKRLRQLREAKGLNPGDIEDRAGVTRAYVTNVENGHGKPTLALLERWARALGVEVCEIFAAGDGKPKARDSSERILVGSQERKLFRFFNQMTVENRSLLISLARDIVKREKIR